jgi:hypothetical protein
MSRIKYIIAWALLLWLVAMPVMAQDGGATTFMGGIMSCTMATNGQ